MPTSMRALQSWEPYLHSCAQDRKGIPINLRSVFWNLESECGRTKSQRVCFSRSVTEVKNGADVSMSLCMCVLANEKVCLSRVNFT